MPGSSNLLPSNNSSQDRVTTEENAILSNLRDRILREAGVDAKSAENKADNKGKGRS